MSSTLNEKSRMISLKCDYCGTEEVLNSFHDATEFMFDNKWAIKTLGGGKFYHYCFNCKEKTTGEEVIIK